MRRRVLWSLGTWRLQSLGLTVFPFSRWLVGGDGSLRPRCSVQCQTQQGPGKRFSLWSTANAQRPGSLMGVTANWRLLPGCPICLCFQHFITENFKHTAKVTKQDSKHPFTQHSDSTVNILLYLPSCGCFSLANFLL